MGDIQASGIQRRMREFRPISALKSHKQRCRKFTCLAILLSRPSPSPKQPRPPSDPSFAVIAHFSAKRPFCGFSATFPDRATRGVTLTNGEVGLWNCGDVPCFPPNLRAKSGTDHGMMGAPFVGVIFRVWSACFSSSPPSGAWSSSYLTSSRRFRKGVSE